MAKFWNFFFHYNQRYSEKTDTTVRSAKTYSYTIKIIFSILWPASVLHMFAPYYPRYAKKRDTLVTYFRSLFILTMSGYTFAKVLLLQNCQTYSEERVTILYSANSLKFNCYNHYYFLGLATFLHVIFRYYLWHDEKKIVSWGTRTIFCSNIIFTNNSTCDLPHFCMCSLGSTHDTLGKDMLPGDPRTTLSSMIQIISNSICDWTHFSNILFGITKDTLRKGMLLWYTTMRSAKSL